MSCIVVVDDLRTSRRIISQLASSVEENANVVSFADPIDALSYVKEHTPDLLITDFSMPSIDGAEFIRRFRHTPNCGDVPAVVVTAYENPESRRLAFEAGTTDYLSLPINFDEFRLRTRNLLALRHAHRRVGADEGFGESSSVDSHLIDADARVQALDGLLQTVSGKLVSKIKKLDILSGDFQNLLAATRASMIFVDGAMRIRLFTPEACALYRLTERDIGRSLLNVESYIRYFDLEADVASVRATGASIDRYLEHRATSARYSLRLAPSNYRDSTLGGASLGFRKLDTWYSGRA